MSLGSAFEDARKAKTVVAVLAVLLVATLIALIVVLVRPGGASTAGDECEDGVCPIPTASENGLPVYAIVSPVGYHAVDMIEQAPRLDSLDGKKIALVGGSFRASVTHDELKKCIEEAYPTARVFMFQEVGAGGPYSVFGQSSQTVAFQGKLAELGIDAVVSGNCGCGLCTTKEAGSSIAAEYSGIPTVTIGAPSFIAEIHSTGVNRGVPVLRSAEYPGAFASASEDELRRNTRETVWPQVESALTDAITPDEAARYATTGKRPYDEVVFTGTYDEIQEFCQVNEWSDGQPVVPPTDVLVKEYLRFTPYQASDVLGVYAPAYRECTAYTVAANAVMAGVPRELMPVCVALTQALDDAEWRKPLSSTHGWSPYAWLNGPLARQLGVDSGQGMLNEPQNEAIGRFMSLMMLNLGGYYVKENRMGTFGYLDPFAFAEDERACLNVGWQPYHVTQGYGLNANTVTAASALNWGNNVTPSTDDPERIMELLAFDITEKQQNGLGNTNPQVYRTVMVTEAVAGDLARGYAAKSDLEDALVETARRPLFMRAYASYWANTGSTPSDELTFDEYYDKLKFDPEERAAETNVPEWLKGITGESKVETIATMQKGQTPLLVAGDADRNKFMVVPGGGYATVEIKLPDNWDELVAPMGYEPLDHFILDGAGQALASDAAEPPAETGGSDDVVAPSNLADGEYRIVPSNAQMTEAGRILKGESGASSGWSYGADSAQNLDASEGFEALMKGLFTGCSLTIEGGKVAGITLRPVVASQKNSGNAMALDADALKSLDVTVGVVTRQSKQEGKATEDGASFTASPRLAKFALDLGGEPVVDAGSTPGLFNLEAQHRDTRPEGRCRCRGEGWRAGRRRSVAHPHVLEAGSANRSGRVPYGRLHHAYRLRMRPYITLMHRVSRERYEALEQRGLTAIGACARNSAHIPPFPAPACFANWANLSHLFRLNRPTM